MRVNKPSVTHTSCIVVFICLICLFRVKRKKPCKTVQFFIKLTYALPLKALKVSHQRPK